MLSAGRPSTSFHFLSSSTWMSVERRPSFSAFPWHFQDSSRKYPELPGGSWAPLVKSSGLPCDPALLPQPRCPAPTRYAGPTGPANRISDAVSTRVYPPECDPRPFSWYALLARFPSKWNPPFSLLFPSSPSSKKLCDQRTQPAGRHHSRHHHRRVGNAHWTHVFLPRQRQTIARAALQNDCERSQGCASSL
jgi:hypothetical protein